MTTKKKIVTILLSVAGVCAAGAGVTFAVRGAQKSEVMVVPVSDLNNGGYWGDSSTMEGMVASDASQNVYLTDTQSVEQVLVPEKGSEFNSWCIRNVIASPDRRTKDTYAIVDVFNGYKEKMNEKGMSVFSLTNSQDVLENLGFQKADDTEASFIKNKVLKLNKDKKK